MDAVMDLTARAVSFITFIQDVYLKGPVLTGKKMHVPFRDQEQGTRIDNIDEYIQAIKKDEDKRRQNLWFQKVQDKGTTSKISGNANSGRELYTGFQSKIIELVWLSAELLQEGDSDDQAEIKLAEDYLIFLCKKLGDWVNDNYDSLQQLDGNIHWFSPPFLWRKVISRYIYLNPKQRVELAVALEYIPIQLVLALGGSTYESTEQRILQWWPQDEKKENDNQVILSNTEKKLQQDFIEKAQPPSEEGLPGGYSNNIKHLLTTEKTLIRHLQKAGASLPFEYILTEELNEVEVARQHRKKELVVIKQNSQGNAANSKTENEKPNEGNASKGLQDDIDNKLSDPIERAKQLKLFALAFSGGGIRSATFNLGILQGLSKKGIISQVDYLSTVSGGGYIGSWFVTWVKRDGSVKKVADRLNPEASADPLGDEVRPIRWLRMFSNYLSPNKSIMSVDAWTIGGTWLRNALLNQVMIFFVLLSGLLALRSVFELWDHPRLWSEILTGTVVYYLSLFLLVLLAIIIGSNMQWYDGSNAARRRFNLESSKWLNAGISFMAILAYTVSATLYKHAEVDTSFNSKLIILWPAALVAFFILLGVAIWGKYYKCVEAFQRKEVGFVRARTIFIIVYTALLASAIGGLALTGVWELFEKLRNHYFEIHKAEKFLGFCFGPPAVLFVFAVTVVARMALLGRYFPDERREWWGRMGAVVNRLSFSWMLVSLLVSYLLLHEVIGKLVDGWEGAPVTIGGWIVLVAGTVKAAFNSNTSGKEKNKGFKTIALNLLSLAGPYIFILGLLIFLPGVAEPLLKKDIFPDFMDGRDYLKATSLALIAFGLGLFLSRRIGVNEFSMHHFYRNRLVRAYLGATRRKANRERTANPFTAFDKLDDEKLSGFTKHHGYYGPYPVLNTALNASQVTDLSRQDRKAESFIFSPLYCGFDFSKVRASINSRIKSYDYGYRRTYEYAYPNDNGPAIGTAMAISGAAVNPNQGYHSSPAVAFLLTVFNVSMGWWIGNPRKGKWQQSDPKSGLMNLVRNLTANTSTRENFVCLSDGGHFDNMGLYEMVRRRCSLIILGDGEQDEEFTCEGLANAIRRCRIDFGAEIIIDTSKIINRSERFSEEQHAIGSIKYSGEEEPSGVLIYLKSSISGNEPVDVIEYAQKNETFPHQTTGDQFFDEAQFESYRKLGMHIIDEAMKDPRVTTALISRSPDHLRNEDILIAAKEVD